MSDNIQLIVNGITVYQTGATPEVAPPNGPPVAPPVYTPPSPVPQPPAPPVNSTVARQVMRSTVLIDTVNKQMQSTWLNSSYPLVDTVVFPFDIPAEATGTRVIEFTNASYATNASVRAAISRSVDDILGVQGYAFPGRNGLTLGSNVEIGVNGAAGEFQVGSGRYYLILQLDNLAAYRALPNGYQADRLAWFRDTTAREA